MNGSFNEIANLKKACLKHDHFKHNWTSFFVNYERRKECGGKNYMRRRQKSPIKRMFNFFIKLTGVGLVIGIVIFSIFFLFRIENIKIMNGERYTDEEIINFLITDKTDEVSFIFYLKQIIKEQKKIPFITKIDVKLIDNHSIELYVYEKLVVGCIEYMGSYMYFDGDGIIVENTKEQISSIPIVTGLLYQKIVLYQPLEIQKNELFNVILNLSKYITNYDLPVNEIRFSADYEVILLCDDDEIMLGRRENYDEQLHNLQVIFEEIQKTEYENQKLRIYIDENGRGYIQIIE